uniref:Uncharacterized protein n=1 Tax=Plectus sambesii TaxID=2011161 RepID=A0A914XPY6_9BILA
MRRPAWAVGVAAVSRQRKIVALMMSAKIEKFGVVIEFRASAPSVSRRALVGRPTAADCPLESRRALGDQDRVLISALSPGELTIGSNSKCAGDINKQQRTAIRK